MTVSDVSIGAGSGAPLRFLAARRRTSSASNRLVRPSAARVLLSSPRVTYAYTVSAFTPSRRAACAVVNVRSVMRPASHIDSLKIDDIDRGGDARRTEPDRIDRGRGVREPYR